MGDTISPASLNTSFEPDGQMSGFEAGSAKSRSPTGTISSAGSKRKRGGNEPKFYAVRVGYKPGVYYTWPDCLAQVKGFKKATYKSFTSFADAESFLAGIDPSLDPNSSSFVQTKFYGVQRGRVPGVYTNWPSAQQQIVGFTRPRHRGFATRAEAETFVKEGDVADVRTESPQPSTHAPRQVDQASLTVAAPNFAPGAPLGKGTEPVPKKPKRPRKDAKASQEIANLAMPTNVLGMPAGDPDFDPGTGPLLPGIEDDFDPQVVLNPHTGQIEWKTDTQKRKTVMQSTGPKPDGVLRIYTDGSSLKNGQGGAIGGIGVYFGDGDPRNISEPLMGSRQTNNRAELTAIIRALDIAPRNRDVRIYTDSSYSINCVTDWFRTWRRNNWTLSNHKPVENRDLIEGILAKMEERQRFGAQTTYEWLRGHSKDHGNTQADKLAVTGARNARAS
ncbi:MAG: hypothetical protein M1815_001101 [Lichina confinis]|nr:MAG: hypothetical protein M1815_001101 [Lichina confinis]